MTSTLRLWSRTIRAEGPLAVRDRLLDRWGEHRRGPRLPPERGAWPAAPILNVLGVDLSARGGGVPIQLRARLRRESSERRVALLARQQDGRFRLELWRDGHAGWATLPGGGWGGDPLQDDARWCDTIELAAALVSAGAVHVENLAGLSLVSLAALTHRNLPVVVSAHDFAGFCRRSHVWESSGSFCGYSTDARRCERCLTATRDPFAIDQERHRALAAEILSAAAAIVCPSEFLRAKLFELIPWSAGPEVVVVPPGLEYANGAPQSPRRPGEVAFVGGGAEHKGGARFATLAAAVAAGGASVTVYGGNGHHNLLALNGLANVRVRGYYRAGSLPALLARQGAAVALLLPGVPETFSLALSDAWAAGVPVVAPAVGAIAERLRQGGGRLLDANPSDGDVLSAIDRLRREPAGPMPPPPTAGSAARRHLDLYRRRGFVSER